MTANWTSGVRWQYPAGYGDVEPMLANPTVAHPLPPPIKADFTAGNACIAPCTSTIRVFPNNAVGMR